MKKRLIQHWQAWVEVWTAIRVCREGKDKLLRTRWLNGRFVFVPSADEDLQAYMESRNVLEQRVPRLSRWLSNFGLI